jgi:hypothetical protein
MPPSRQEAAARARRACRSVLPWSLGTTHSFAAPCGGWLAESLTTSFRGVVAYVFPGWPAQPTIAEFENDALQ